MTLRLAAGLSQHELAAALGVTQSAVSQWESGETTPRFASLIDIAAVIGVPVSDLLSNDWEAAA